MQLASGVRRTIEGGCECRTVRAGHLAAEIAEKQARSIKYLIAIAKLPLARDFDEFAFADTPINEILLRDLAGGGFLERQRNVVLIGNPDRVS